MNRENKDEETRDTNSEETGQKRPFSWSKGMPEMMGTCCGDNRGEGSANMATMMARCGKPMMIGCWWFALFAVALAGVALLLGYYLSPEAVQMLWMVCAGLVFAIGLFGLIVMRRIAASMGSVGCC